MDTDKNCDSKGYILAAILGAIGSGIVIALATKAVPKLMQHMTDGG